MTHRDELLALKARIDALEQDIDETRSENELLRAAHVRKTRELETLRRSLEEEAAPSEEPSSTETTIPPPHRRATHHLRFAMLAMSAMLLGTMMWSTGISARAGRIQAARAYAAPGVTHLLRVGTVSGTQGAAPFAVGDSCTVERIPVQGGAFDCRIEVRCGDQTLYGDDPRTGFVRCGGRERVVDPDASAFDGDPAMTMDLAQGIVTVEDRVGLVTQRVQIQLGAPVVDAEVFPL